MSKSSARRRCDRLGRAERAPRTSSERRTRSRASPAARRGRPRAARRRARRTSSEVEEDGLLLALDADVESVAIVGLLGEQRLTPVGRDARSTGSSRCPLVEVDARRHGGAAARARRRGRRRTGACRHADDVPSARRRRCRARGRTAGGSRLPASRPARPGSGRAGAVEDRARRSATPPGIRRRGPSSHGSPIARYGPTVCEGVGSRLKCSSSNGVCVRPRRRCRTRTRAPSSSWLVSMLKRADHPLAQPSGRAPS